MKKLSVDLWFDKNAEEAVNFYTSIFDNSKVRSVLRYGPDTPGPEGSVMYIDFELEGQRFGAINAGPEFKFSPAISIVVSCDTQEEIDEMWTKLSAVPEAEMCGWVQDKYGVSWQIVAPQLNEMLLDEDAERSNRVMQAMLQMKKIDIAALEKAAAG